MHDLDDTVRLILSAAVIVLLLTLAVFVTPIAMAAIAGYVGYRLYVESPARAERIARAETMALYHAAVAVRNPLSDEAVYAGLAAAWPSTTPAPCVSNFSQSDASSMRLKASRPTCLPHRPCITR